MENKEYGILTFEGTQHAMKAEAYLIKKEIKTKTIPTPRDITLSCGLAIRIGIEDIEKIKEFYDGGELKLKNLYSLKESTEGRLLKKIL